MKTASDSPRANTLSSDFDLEKIRADFPILREAVHGKPLIYLDNAASTQKPQAVIDAVVDYYRHSNANIHRGVHHLSQKATDLYEESRECVRSFLNARDVGEVIFTRGTTEGINLVASSFARPRLEEGDEVLISTMEHHSNIVPWQLACEASGAVLKIIPINSNGEIIFEEYERLLGPATKLVSVVHTSNALGTINPIGEIIATAHAHHVPVLVDAAQASAHTPLDVQALDCDFLAFSSHKIYGPTGVGVLYGKKAHLNAMPPYQGGGDMIRTVSFEKTTYNDLPNKFEAGTPNMAGVIGLAAAIRYVQAIGFENIEAHETALLEEATARVAEIDGLRIVGTASHKAATLSFVMDGAHPHDIGTILDREGVAIRAGHHCTMPLMEHLGIPATARASFAIYNKSEEIDMLIAALGKVKEIFG